MSNRISKHDYYLNLAFDTAKRSTCLRRCYGAVIVNNDEIISTGYNGAPRGEVNCSDCGACLRQEFGIKSGEHYELCRSVHAEANAIISASRKDMIGATLYLSGYEYDKPDVEQNVSYPCKMCQRLIRNAGIRTIVYRKNGEIQIADVGTFEHDNIISKDMVKIIAKIVIILKELKLDNLIHAQEIEFINRIRSHDYINGSVHHISITQDNKQHNSLLITNDISHMIDSIYRDYIYEKKYDYLTEFIKSSMRTKFYNINEYSYDYLNKLNGKPMMECILRYLLDEIDVSKYIKLKKSDILENELYFSLVNVKPYVLNAAWYLFHKLDNCIIAFD